MHRRDFLRGIGAGAAVLTLPGGLVASCAPREQLVGPARTAKEPPPPPPAAPVGHATHFDAFGVDQGLLRRTLERGLSRGGNFCEIYLQHQVSHWVGMEDGAINRAYTTVDLGAGIRVLKGEATGFAYCEELTEAALGAAASTAAAVADSGATARPAPFAVRPLQSRYQVDVPWTDVGVDQKLPIIELAEKTARERDSRIIKITVFLTDETSHILIANSEGLLVEDEQPMAVLSVSCVAEHKGKTESSGESFAARDSRRVLSKKTIERVARKAADNTVLLFDVAPAPIGELPVVLGPGVTGILLHEAIGHGMEADFNRKGVSIYARRIGQRVAPQDVTIIDGAEGRLRGSLNMDDEGTETESTILVERGILRSYLHDRISASHYKVRSTGSGRRQSFRYPPVPRMRNTYMLKGRHKPEEIIASVERGLYAENFSNGQVFIGAGDFTFYLKHGRLIEKGKLTSVVKDANLIGNGPKVLEQAAMVGDDLELYSGAGYCGKDGQRVPVGFGLPTVKVGGISIGGRKS